MSQHTTKIRKGFVIAMALFALLLFTAGDADAKCIRWSDAPGIIASNKLKSPSEVRSRAMKRGGEVISMDLCPSGSGYVYRLRIISGQKRARDIVIDAGSGRIISGDFGSAGDVGAFIKKKIRSKMRGFKFKLPRRGF